MRHCSRLSTGGYAVEMSPVEMDVRKYLTRIGYTGPVEPSLDVLRSITVRHMFSVPFENLSIHCGQLIKLNLPFLYDKIVNQNRGGFCYENNGLFSWLLHQLGFQVTLLSGQVKNERTGFYGPPLDHLLLMVSLEGKGWLCDVGFGARTFSAPLSLEISGPQETRHQVCRLRKDQDMVFVEWQENRGADEDWKELYKFTLEPRCLEDFAEMCEYQQNSPCSIFSCKSFCTLLKPGGITTYIGHRLVTTTFPTAAAGGELEITTRELRDEEITGVLAEEFGIVLPSPLVPKDETTVTPAVMY